MQTGILAEFATPEDLVRALRELRVRGYRELDTFTPYPVREAEHALGLDRSPLSRVVFPFAVGGAGTAYGIQWFCNAYDYPLNVGGRPPHSAPMFVPITFEMGVLTAALVGLVALFLLSRLPALYHPVFDVEGFERASIDRFWIGVDARDPSFDRARVERDLEELGAGTIAWAGGRT